MTTMRPFQLIGHRGARGEAPENTISGFRHAQRLGLQTVEIDVRLTCDDKLVVIHDATVDRTTNANGPVSDFTASELAALDARSECTEWPEIVGIPTLDEALPVLDDFPMIQIELKKDTNERLEAVAEAVIEAIRERGIQDRVVLSSFEPFALEVIARLAPEQSRAYIGAWDTPEYMETALRLGCTQADISLTSSSSAMVAQAHAHGMRVVGFQVNTPEALDRALAWEMDAATSDYPSRILPLIPDA
jgi:glycerophosphoryl diester phosphodiesterase